MGSIPDWGTNSLHYKNEIRGNFLSEFTHVYIHLYPFSSWENIFSQEEKKKKNEIRTLSNTIHKNKLRMD